MLRTEPQLFHVLFFFKDTKQSWTILVDALDRKGAERSAWKAINRNGFNAILRGVFTQSEYEAYLNHSAKPQASPIQKTL